MKEGQLVNPETGQGAVEIHQIKGKGNSMPTKYKDYILRFINQAQHMDIEGLPDFNSMPMVVNDGLVELLNVDESGFELSSAETVLEAL